MRCLLRSVLLAVVTSTGLVCGGQAAAPQGSTASAVSPTFEVATIKLNKSGSGGSRSSLDDYGNLTTSNISIVRLLHIATGVPEGRILGGPDWSKSSRFDIQAKPDGALAEHLKNLQSNAERRVANEQMLEALLADRFALKMHRETRELPVYALVVAKNGPKIKPAVVAEGSSVNSHNGHLTIKSNAAMAALAEYLENNLDRVVVDKTGIEGGYEFSFDWNPEELSAAKHGAANSSADEGPSIFTALQEQLGLKLESQKGPVEVIVIDHAELPSEN